jgi:hypothetical protein
VVEKAIKSLDNAMSDESVASDIESRMFDSALIGLSKGKMEYENDPILPLVLSTIEKEVQRIQSLSPKEQTDLISLTKD